MCDTLVYAHVRIVSDALTEYLGHLCFDQIRQEGSILAADATFYSLELRNSFLYRGVGPTVTSVPVSMLMITVPGAQKIYVKGTQHMSVEIV
ncbi:Fc.00g083090.m01.CDS01 [Cosmosporella sp. VM-42]